MRLSITLFNDVFSCSFFTTGPLCWCAPETVDPISPKKSSFLMMLTSIPSGKLETGLSAEIRRLMRGATSLLISKHLAILFVKNITG